jgi:hypothetical protein
MESPKLKIGDIIMLIYMEDPNPVDTMSLGVVRTGPISVFGDDQYDVNWEDGRKLAIISGVDRWETEESLIDKGNEKLLRVMRRKLENFNK